MKFMMLALTLIVMSSAFASSRGAPANRVQVTFYQISNSEYAAGSVSNLSLFLPGQESAFQTNHLENPVDLPLSIDESGDVIMVIDDQRIKIGTLKDSDLEFVRTYPRARSAFEADVELEPGFHILLVAPRSRNTCHRYVLSRRGSMISEVTSRVVIRNADGNATPLGQALMRNIGDDCTSLSNSVASMFENTLIFFTH